MLRGLGPSLRWDDGILHHSLRSPYLRPLLIHGVFDGIVPPAIGWRYQKRAKEFGESVELHALDNAGHFELIAPWTPAGKLVVAKILEALK